MNVNVNLSHEQVCRRNAYLNRDGSWRPNNCQSLHQVAIIIPYRDRKEHLAKLLAHLHPILHRQSISYKIFVIEQVINISSITTLHIIPS